MDSWHNVTRYWPIFVAALLLLCSTANAGEPKYRDAIMIDTGEYNWCHYDCAPFDRSTFFFCLQLGDQILIGSHKADWFWQYDSSKMLGFKGKKVSVRFDNEAIWMIRTDGKDMHLSRDYSRDEFSRPECTAEIHRHWLRDLEPAKRPETVPLEAVLVPQGPRSFLRGAGPHFWVKCSADREADWNLCEIWDENGVKYKSLKCVNASGQPVPSAELDVDPLTTETDYEIHLKNGTVLNPLR